MKKHYIFGKRIREGKVIKILIMGLTVMSYSSLVFAQENKQNKKENELNKIVEQSISEDIKEKKIEKIEDVVFNLDFDRNLLSQEELNCYVPFSSWKKSVNFYDKCNIKITEKNTAIVSLMSLQNKIRVIYENNQPRLVS